MFIGRKNEIDELLELRKLKKAAFVVCTGRRRIGKSTLVEMASKEFSHLYEFQGLHPKEAPTMELQLAHFVDKMRIYFKTPKMIFSTWTEAFTELAERISSKSTLVFFDEISWMSSGSETFSAELKSAWDMLFKKKDHLIMTVAGSVSSWIEQNILQHLNFLGRISLNINLEELPLNTLKEFWSQRGVNISTYNLIKTASIFGGIPLYLELQNPKESVEQNLNRLCFKKGGPLNNEFEKIFSDIFVKRGPVYKKIVIALLEQPMNHIELAKAIKVEKSGALTRYLNDLVLSDFLSKDITYDLKGKPTKFSKFRVCDNYIRFALKYIEPNIEKINAGYYKFNSLDSLNNWKSVLGLQFENLILRNKNSILDILQIDYNSILSCSPYFQTKTVKNKGSCQIDLLIVLKNYHMYLCEIKLQQKFQLR